MSSSKDESGRSPKSKRRKAIDRRQFLVRSSATAAAAALLPSHLPAFKLGKGLNPNRDIFVQIYLRGGMDGLSAVIPQFQSTELAGRRPNTSIPKAGSGGMTPESIVLPGSGGYELNAAAADLLPMYMARDLAIVHLCGLKRETFSHFDAMKFMEFGWPDSPAPGPFSGWLARHINFEPDCDPNYPLRALSLTHAAVQTLATAEETYATPKPENSSFFGNGATKTLRKTAMTTMYTAETPPVSTATVTAFDVVELLASVNWAGHTTAYPDSTLGKQLKAAATMIDQNVPLEAVAMELGGWDDHNAQGCRAPGGKFYDRLEGLVAAITAFYDDMKARQHLGRVIMMVMTEFGRRVYDNGSAGTDHGRAGVALVIGGGVGAGGVYPNPSVWPDLSDLNVENLPVHIDIQDVMLEILRVRMGATAPTSELFPGLDQNENPPGIVV